MQYESLWVMFPSVLLLVSCSKNNADIDIEQPKRTEMLAFKDVNHVTMTEEGVIDHQTVLVDETKIVEIGPANLVVIPEKAKIIEGKGAYLMPGLADMHVHILRDKWPVSQLKLYLANGVTTIRSLGTTADDKEHKAVVDWSSQIKEGMNEIAHIKELVLELIDFDRTKIFKENESLPFIAKAFSEQYDNSDFNDGAFLKKH